MPEQPVTVIPLNPATITITCIQAIVVFLSISALLQNHRHKRMFWMMAYWPPLNPCWQICAHKKNKMQFWKRYRSGEPEIEQPTFIRWCLLKMWKGVSWYSRALNEYRGPTPQQLSMWSYYSGDFNLTPQEAGWLMGELGINGHTNYKKVYVACEDKDGLKIPTARTHISVQCPICSYCVHP